VTLLVIAVGFYTGMVGLSQSLVITIIVIEVAIVAVAGGIALRVFRYNDNLDVRRLRNLRG
jgi:multisubunit Na+/H+ antiporter MnhC subunit